jgi:hypothetical protein
MSEGVQVSSTRGLQASPSTGRRFGWINPATEHRSKHRGDLANAKKILSILPYYIPPLDSMVNQKNNPCDFDYTLITVHTERNTRSWESVGTYPTTKEQ